MIRPATGTPQYTPGSDRLEAMRQADGADMILDDLTPDEQFDRNIAAAVKHVPSAVEITGLGRIALAIHNLMVLVRRHSQRHNDLAARVAALEAKR